MILRPYQLEGIAKIRAAIVEGHKRILCVLPTGGGKTCVAAHIISNGHANGTRFVFIAHRRELIGQAAARVIEWGVPERDVGIVMANGWVHLDGKRTDMRRPDAGVQVASVDTLRNRPSPPRAEVVFVDETHRVCSPTYLRILDTHYPQAIVIGLTATPFRADGRSLGEFYDVIVVLARPSDLIASRGIVEPRVYSVPPDQLPDLSGVEIKGNDYDPVALAMAVDKGQLVGNIVDHWLRRAEGRTTVAFAASVEHSKHLTERFKASGVRAEHLDGTTPNDERAAILARLASGETQVCVNMGVLIEGFDLPRVKCIILARPTKSTGMMIQCSGRGLRPWGELEPLILDHAGCVLEHGLPTMDRVYTLEMPRKKKGKTAASCKTCPKCYAILPSSARQCLAPCDHVWGDGSEELIDETEGELVEDKGELWARMLASWTSLLERAEREQWGIGRERKEFRKMWSRNPPIAFPKRQLAPSLADKMNEFKRLLDLEKRKGYRWGWAAEYYSKRFGEAPPTLPEVRQPAIRAIVESKSVVPWSI